MRNFTLAILLLLPAAAFAQLGENDDTFGAPETYHNFGSNFSVYAQNNVMLGGVNYAHHVDYSWSGFGVDDDDEPIDEIIVIAKRRVSSGWQLFSYVNLNLSGNEVCTNYTDGGHCNASEIAFDPEDMPIQGQCQTLQGSAGPLTSQQAEELNVEYINSQTFGASYWSAALGFFVASSGGTTIPLGLIAAAGGVALSMNGFIDELPYHSGDIVDWSLEVCNDGDGGFDATMDVTVS